MKEVGPHTSKLPQEATARDVKGIAETPGSGLLILESGANSQTHPVSKVNTIRKESQVTVT